MVTSTIDEVHQALLGSWTLVAWERSTPTGRRLPMGAAARGELMCDQSGGFQPRWFDRARHALPSATGTKPDRTRWQAHGPIISATSAPSGSMSRNDRRWSRTARSTQSEGHSSSVGAKLAAATSIRTSPIPAMAPAPPHNGSLDPCGDAPAGRGLSRFLALPP